MLFGSLTALLFLAACSPSAFERQHEQAVFQNPTGVELEIRTKDGRKQFSVSEPVQFEEFYAAKFAGLWHIEVIDGGNEASAADVVHIRDGTTILNQPREPFVGVVCCDSRHVWLSLDPVRVPYKMFANRNHTNLEGYANADWHKPRLPKKPGKYQVYITTARVFGQGTSTTTDMGKGVPISSNVLTLEVK